MDLILNWGYNGKVFNWGSVGVLVWSGANLGRNACVGSILSGDVQDDVLEGGNDRSRRKRGFMSDLVL